MLEPKNLQIAPREDPLRKEARKSWKRYQPAHLSLARGVSSGRRRLPCSSPSHFSPGQAAPMRDKVLRFTQHDNSPFFTNVSGHSHHRVVEAIAQRPSRVFTFGAQHHLQFELVERLTEILSCGDFVYFVNRGSEAVQATVLLAQAYTGRLDMLKSKHLYYTREDPILLSYHSIPSEIEATRSLHIGVIEGKLPNDEVFVIEWNDCKAVQDTFVEHWNETAVGIIEPLLRNSGCIAPVPGFLQFLRNITMHCGALVIFDKVITGYSPTLSGAQVRYDVVPDLAPYTEAVGGSSLGVFAGRRHVMDLITGGQVAHTGALHGNSIMLAETQASLETLTQGGDSVYQNLLQGGRRVLNGIKSRLKGPATKLWLSVKGWCSMPLHGPTRQTLLRLVLT